jgi:hypothetical protein
MIGSGPRRGADQAGRAGMIIALLLLLALGAVALVLVPRQSRVGAARRDVMTRFMEQDYGCCDLSTARSTPRCAETLKEVARLAGGKVGPGFTEAARNATARCPAAELLAFAGDPAALREPVPFLAARLKAADPGVARRAARLLASDGTIAREIAQGVLHGRGPLCSGGGPQAERPCPGAGKLVNEIAALFADEKEELSDREKAAALLDELAEAAAPAVPALLAALDSRTAAIRGLSFGLMTRLGPAASTALSALNRQVHREPSPGVRQQMLSDLGRLDPKARCCYGLFHAPDPLCGETLGIVARRSRERSAERLDADSDEDCPAALVLEVSGTSAAIAHPMPYLARALKAPDVPTRRRAAAAVALFAGTLQGQGRVDREVVGALQDAFRSGIPALSLDAAEALRQCRDSDVAGGMTADPEPYRKTLADASSDRRAAAAWALGQLGKGAASAVPDLRSALEGSDEALADAAYGALNRIARASGLGSLGVKRDGKYEVAPEVMAALDRLSAQERKTP